MGFLGVRLHNKGITTSLLLKCYTTDTTIRNTLC